jgi:hypothetical protein
MLVTTDRVRQARDMQSRFTAYNIVAILGLILAVGALVIAIPAIVKAYAAPTPCLTQKVDLHGVCEETMPVRMCKVGPNAVVSYTAFTCNGLANTSTGPGPLYFQLPPSFRSDGIYTGAFFSSGIVHDGEHPWLGFPGQLTNNGTKLATITYITEVGTIPYVVIGYGLSGPTADTGITPLGQYGLEYGQSLAYTTRSAAGAVSPAMAAVLLGATLVVA